MPFTPFHFGPGLAIHAVAPQQVSFLSFCAVNVLVDVEPLYYMLTGQPPLHRIFHTYIGVSVVIAATVMLAVGVLTWIKRTRFPDFFRWRNLTSRQVLFGAVLGGYSHVFLDSIMHSDIRPLAPFSESNGLLHVIPLSILHVACLALGIAGLMFLGIRKFFDMDESPQ